MDGEREPKTATELLAERTDAWKMARSLLRNSDLHYDSPDVIMLADWLTGEMVDYKDDD